MNIRQLAIVMLSLALAGCAAWQQPASVDTADFRERASVEQSEGVSVRALVLNRSDSKRLFGADLFALKIEPIWLEVINGSDQPVWLLQSGADPDYFSPLEVSWSLHSSFASSNNAAIALYDAGDSITQAQSAATPAARGRALAWRCHKRFRRVGHKRSTGP